MVCSQFQTIGQTADQMTLGELVPGGEWVALSDYIKVYKGDSDVEFEAIYVDEANATYFQTHGMPWVTVGWYDMNNDMDELLNNLNNTQLPLGCTIMAFGANAGAYISTSGEVVESETGKITFEWSDDDIEAGAFKMVGNCTPLPLTLGNFVPGGEWVALSDYIKVYKGDSDVEFEAIYVDESNATYFQTHGMPWVTVGWYDMNNDMDELLNNLNETSMPAGTGIMAFAANTGATIEIPSAL